LKRHLAILEPDLERQFRKQRSSERGLAQLIRVNTEQVGIQDATHREKACERSIDVVTRRAGRRCTQSKYVRTCNLDGGEKPETIQSLTTTHSGECFTNCWLGVKHAYTCFVHPASASARNATQLLVKETEKIESSRLSSASSSENRGAIKLVYLSLYLRKGCHGMGNAIYRSRCG